VDRLPVAQAAPLYNNFASNTDGQYAGQKPEFFAAQPPQVMVCFVKVKTKGLHYKVKNT
jgi:hypothetical protein